MWPVLNLCVSSQVQPVRVGQPTPVPRGPGRPGEPVQPAQLALVHHRLADAAGIRHRAQVRGDGVWPPSWSDAIGRI